VHGSAFGSAWISNARFAPYTARISKTEHISRDRETERQRDRETERGGGENKGGRIPIEARRERREARRTGRATGLSRASNRGRIGSSYISPERPCCFFNARTTSTLGKVDGRGTRWPDSREKNTSSVLGGLRLVESLRSPASP